MFTSMWIFHLGAGKPYIVVLCMFYYRVKKFQDEDKELTHPGGVERSSASSITFEGEIDGLRSHCNTSLKLETASDTTPTLVILYRRSIRVQSSVNQLHSYT